MNEVKTVVFALNNQVCGVDASQVFQIIKYESVAKIPETPDFVDGVINLRGKVVPVIDLNKRFELGGTEVTRKTKIIISNMDKSFVGFTVNDVSEIINLDPEDIEKPPERIYRKENVYLKGVGKKGEKLISILDLGRILDDGELKTLEKVI